MYKYNPKIHKQKYTNLKDHHIYTNTHDRMADSINELERELQSGTFKDAYVNFDGEKYIDITVTDQIAHVSIDPSLLNENLPYVKTVYDKMKKFALENVKPKGTFSTSEKK